MKNCLKELHPNQKYFFKINKIKLSKVTIFSKEETDLLRKRWTYMYQRNTPEYILLDQPSKYTPSRIPLRHQCDSCKPSRESNGYNWHVFNFAIVPSKEVVPAFLKKFSIMHPKLILLWENCGWLAVKLPTNIVKSIDFKKSNPEDIYVFPKDFKWTFVKTHEDIYYFSKIKSEKSKKIGKK